MSKHASRIEGQYTPLIAGPFGRFARHSSGHVLNALCAYGIPLHLVEQLQFKCQDKLTLGGKHFGTYAYFEGIEHPIFAFKCSTYYDQEATEVHGALQADFRLNLYAHQTNVPTLLIPRHQYTDEFPKYLADKIFFGSNGVRDEELKEMAVNAGARFQWGSDVDRHEFICIEFWRPEFARPLVHHLNTMWQTPKTRQYLH